VGGAVDDVNLLSGTQELRLQAHKGKARPEEGAVAASILTVVYHMLKDGTLYQDLGSNHFQNQRPAVKRP